MPSMRKQGNGVYTRMQMSRFQVSVPYSTEFIVQAHLLEGRWKRRSRMWSFPREDYMKVARLINKLFGTSLPVNKAPEPQEPDYD